MKHSFYFFCFIMLKVLSSFAQSPVMQQLGTEHGLPALTVYRILQDDKGYIWMATQLGICRYDGRKFKIWELNDWMDKEILYLNQDAYGNIWFSNLSTQIGKIEREKVELIFDNSESKTSRITAFKLVGEKIFITKKRTKDHSNEYELTEFTIEKSGEIYQKNSYHGTSARMFGRIVFDKGKLYSNMVLLSNGEEERIGVKNSILTKYLSPSKNKFSKNKAVQAEVQLISPLGIKVYVDISKVYISDSKGFRLLKDFKPILVRQCKLISNSLWVLTSSGTFVFDLETGKEKLSFLPGIACNDVIRDRENNFWVTTSESGVFVIPNFEFSLYKSEQGLQKKEDINSLLQTKDSSLYVGTSAGEITSLDLKPLKQRWLKTGGGGRVMSMAEDDLGTIWVGQDESLSFFTKSNDQPFIVNGLRAIKKVLAGSENRIYIAFSDGVFCLSVSYKRGLPEITLQKQIFEKRTYGLAEDNEGTVWIGSIEGLYLFKNNQTIPFIEEGKHEKYKISSIIYEPDDAIWVSTSDQGVLKIVKGEVVLRLNMDNGLISNNCNTVFKSEELLLIGTDKGLVLYDESNHSSNIINDKSGLSTNDIRTVIKYDNNIWIGTSHGLIRVPITAVQPNIIKPPVYLTNVSILGRDTVVRSFYDLEFNENQIDIDFTGIALKSRGKEQYKYRLKGLNDNWIFTDLRTTRYHSLLPGAYKFEVFAINEAGIQSLQAAEFSFVIATPWWKTTWFYFFTVLGAMFLTGGLVYWRQNERKAIEFAENELREKIRILSLEALQSQMNPHFIFNALNAIQDFFINKDHKSALHYLSKFAQMIRWIFDYSKLNTISLSDEIEFITLYLEIEKMRFGERIDIDFQISENANLLSEEFQLPALIIQPVIENCFKHGLMHKREKGNLSIIFKFSEQGTFHCKISDNGIGRDKAKELSAWRLDKKRAGSLKAIRERLKIFHNVLLSDKEYLKISDLTDANGNPCGTTVDIFIYGSQTNIYAT